MGGTQTGEGAATQGTSATACPARSRDTAAAHSMHESPAEPVVALGHGECVHVCNTRVCVHRSVWVCVSHAHTAWLPPLPLLSQRAETARHADERPAATGTWERFIPKLWGETQGPSLPASFPAHLGRARGLRCRSVCPACRCCKERVVREWPPSCPACRPAAQQGLTRQPRARAATPHWGPWSPHSNRDS